VRQYWTWVVIFNSEIIHVLLAVNNVRNNLSKYRYTYLMCVVYVPVKLKLHPPGNPPGHLNFWRLACSNFLPSGHKCRSNAPAISTEVPLLKDKFRLQSNTVHAFQREICGNDIFKLLLKTLLKDLFFNKCEILSGKSVKPCKNQKNSRVHYTRTRDKSGSNSSPFQANFQILPSPGVQCWNVHSLVLLFSTSTLKRFACEPIYDFIFPSH